MIDIDFIPSKLNPNLFLLIVLLSLQFSFPVSANNENAQNEIESDIDTGRQVRIYRSPEERREAGIGHQITDWLKASGLMEIEGEIADLVAIDGHQTRIDEGLVYNGQLAFELEISEVFSAEITVEAEREFRTTAFLDEAVLIVDLEPIEIEIGRLSVPFGEYYSHFVTGPMLEFGETLNEAMVFSYIPNDNIELSAFAFRGNIDSASAQQDWGVNTEYLNNDESVKLGIGYLSDLAESDENLLEDFDNRSLNRVGAWNAYALFGFEFLEITAEMVLADSAFSQLEPGKSKPSAYNLELAYFVSDSSQLSFRYERSREIEDAPEEQYGVNFTWRPNRYLVFSVEYLRGQYRDNFAFDEEDTELKHSDYFAAQLAIEF